MADEKKVLTPDSIAAEFRNRCIYVLPPEAVNEELFIEVLSGMIREYGEQQRLEGYKDGFEDGQEGYKYRGYNERI